MTNPTSPTTPSNERKTLQRPGAPSVPAASGGTALAEAPTLDPTLDSTLAALGAEPVAPVDAAEHDRKVASLLLRLEDMSVAQPSALAVLSLVDDPNTTTAQVAGAIESDPTFTAQVMRLANSAYYGLSGRVGNTTFAITVVGFAAIRSLSAMSAAGLTTASKSVPEGFWAHAAGTAAGASLVAQRFGVVAADCFAAGLLHDVGIAFLHAVDRDAHAAILAAHGTHGASLVEAERAQFGMDHAEAAAHVLTQWKFPAQIIEAVADHHGGGVTPFTLAVRVGEALAILSVSDDPDAEALLAEVGIDEAERTSLIELVTERTAEIVSSLPV